MDTTDKRSVVRAEVLEVSGQEMCSFRILCRQQYRKVFIRQSGFRDGNSFHRYYVWEESHAAQQLLHSNLLL
ncbi:hypothetical protein BH23ACT11_BH23ACT11_30380 [soil metagenome]